jgi:propionyl-CoA carboxylase alpha chain
MLAKVIGHGATRELAAAVLAEGLVRTSIHGPVNNRDSLVAILRSPAFLAGDTTTVFLDEHPEVSRPALAVDDQARHVIAASSALAFIDAPDATVPLGWRNVPGVPEFTSLLSRASGEVVTVLQDAGSTFRIARTDGPPFGRVFDLDSSTIDDVVVHVRYTARDGGSEIAHVNVRVGGVAASCVVSRYGDEVFVDDGLCSSAWTIQPRFIDHSTDAAGHGPATKVPGTITAVQVAAGDRVVEGQVLVILEAMKMEHSIRADVDGIVERVLVEVGQSVEAHTVVVEFQETVEVPRD